MYITLDLDLAFVANLKGIFYRTLGASNSPHTPHTPYRRHDLGLTGTLRGCRCTRESISSIDQDVANKFPVCRMQR